MGQIQTGIGLISGLNIKDIVTKLMAINAQSRDAISSRNDALKKVQSANTELMALLYSLKYISDNLGKDEVYSKVTATSSNSGIISVLATGTPAVGSYQYTALQKAQNQQLLSSGLGSLTDPIGTGKISFRFGNNVQHALDLNSINGGSGFTQGKIAITDRSGQRAEIDLSTARSLDDILETINNNTTINVKAQIVGDRIALTDNTHQTASNLIVQEVGAGTTAASLGLAGINAASDTATGQDIVYLSRNTDLNALNDGLGIRTDTILSDIRYKLHDGTDGEIDLSPIQSGGSTVLKEQTLGELMDKINAAAPGKLEITISSDGERLVLTDLTTGSDNFQVSSIHDSKILEDLGLTGSAVDSVITGRKVLAGAKTVLLSSLSGGKGLGTLGTINLTDRNGASASVDLSNAETLEDVINAINAAPVQINAQVNQAKNGIELLDTSGASSGNMIVANGDAANTADKLKIAVDSAAGSVNSGDLHLQIVGLNTKLADLNGGAGVPTGMIRITDSKGVKSTVGISVNVKTVGDLLKTIHMGAASIIAEINDTGDGIAIRDTNNGGSALKIEDIYGSTVTQSLNLLGAPKSIEEGGVTTQIIDGAMTRTIDLSAIDPQLIDINTKLAELNDGAGVARNKFRITDSNGDYGIIDLTDNKIQTVGDLIKAINELPIAVTASISGTNDGIAISDVNNGPGILTITEEGSTTATDLHILGTANTVDIGGVPTQVIDGSASLHPTPYSLQKLRDKINELKAGVTAAILYDGSNKPYRLSLISNQTGRASELLVDASETDISINEIARAQDALLAVGHISSTGQYMLVSSMTNNFTKLLDGATLTIEDTSSNPVTVKVASSDSDILANIRTFVDNYNKFRNKLKDDTAYDSQSDTKAVLTGDSAALRLDIDMSRLISEGYLEKTTIQSLAQIGVSSKDDGTLALDETKLSDALALHRDAVKQLFTTKDTGVSARFSKMIEQLAGPKNSLLELRNQSLQDTIDHNQTRIDDMNILLDAQTTRLLNQFYQMELNLAKLQSNLNALSSIQWMLDSSSSSNSLFSGSSS